MDSLIKEINTFVNELHEGTKKCENEETFDVSLTPEQLSVIVDMAIDACGDGCDEQSFAEAVLDILEDVPGMEMEEDKHQALNAAKSELERRQRQ